MNNDQIIDEILLFTKSKNERDDNGGYFVRINSLIHHFINKYPELDHRPIHDMIDEIDARGWLLKRDSTMLIFDPATFN